MDDHDTCRVLIEGAGARSDPDDDDDRDGADEPHLLYILNLILNGTARLNVLLPTATILAFTIFAPLLTDDGGNCGSLSRWLMAAFVASCAASCVFFTFTDSFRASFSSGRLYYGVATFRGIWAFNARRKGPHNPAAYRLTCSDLFHASLSLLAFLAFAASHGDVMGCYGVKLPRKVANTVPLVVGFVVSVSFVLFPSKRRGIGYPFLLQRDAVFMKG